MQMNVFRKAVIISTGCLVLIAAVYAVKGILREYSYESVSQCPVGIAFIDPNIKTSVVIRYCDKKGVVKTVAQTKKREDADKETILGYDRASKNWFLDFYFGDDYYVQDGWTYAERKSFILKISQHGEKQIRLDNNGLAANYLVNGRLYEDIEVETGRSMEWINGLENTYYNDVRCYDMAGVPKYQHRLEMPNYTMLTSEGTTFAPNGLVAMAVNFVEHPCTQILLFDAKGKLMKNLGKGIHPSFDPGGTRIAYFDSWWRRTASNDSYGEGSSKVIIYDIKSGKKRYLDLSRRWQSPYYCRWSPDGKWLICGYCWMIADFLPQKWAVYAVNITGITLKWYKYPCAIETVDWVPVDVQ